MFWLAVIGVLIAITIIPLAFHHTIEGVARSRMPTHVRAIIIGGLCIAAFILVFII